jgi:hypothetical protein
MRREAFRGVTAGCAAAIVLLAGCGYRAGFTMPDGMDTIHVNVFENRTFYRGLDFELTELVKTEILVRTDLVVVRQSTADIVLACVLERVDKSVLQEDENDLPQEVELKVVISASATNRSGETLFSQKGLSKSVRYVVALGETEGIARSRALREVAEELVYRMAEEWCWGKNVGKKREGG